MLSMNWCEQDSVGVRSLDDDHKKVFVMINDLNEAILAGHNEEVLKAVVARLVEYTMTHLAREEEYFAQTHFLGEIAHKKEHERMVKRVQNLQGRLNGGSVAKLSLEMVGFLQDWWVTHIQRSDKKYRACFNANGIV